jgi:long-subunit fatty acid transport protein
LSRPEFEKLEVYVKKILINLILIAVLCGISEVNYVFAQDPFAFGEVSFLAEERGFGARALGLGGAFSTLADDYTAIYWNPAGLGLMKSNEFFTSLTHNNRSNETTFLSSTNDNSSSKTSFGSIGLAYPVDVYQGSLVIAFGYNRVFNFNSLFGYSGYNRNIEIEYEIDGVPLVLTEINQDESVEVEGHISQYSFGISFEAAQNVLVGGTINLWKGEHNYYQLFEEIDTENIYWVYPDDYDYYKLENSINTSITGFDLKLGMMYWMQDYLRIGATINSPRYFKLNENWTFKDEIAFDNGDIEPFDDDSGEFDFKVITPFIFGAGFTYMFPNGSFNGEFSYTDWPQLKYVDDSPIEGVDKNAANRNIKQTLSGSFSPRFGIEYRISDITLRAGFGLVPSPVKDADKDSDRKYFSGGVGVPLGPEATFNIGVRHGSWKTISLSDLSLINVAENQKDLMVLTSINFKFK